MEPAKLKRKNLKGKLSSIETPTSDALKTSLENSERIKQLEETIQKSIESKSSIEATYQQERFMKLEEKTNANSERLRILEERAISNQLVKTQSKNTRFKLKELSKDFLSTISVYGVPKVLKADNLIVKLIWLIAILASISFGMYAIDKSVKDYYQFNVITNVQIVYPSIVTYPAVTICQYSEYMKNSYINDTLVGSETIYDPDMFIHFIDLDQSSFKDEILDISQVEFFTIPKIWSATCFRFNGATKDLETITSLSEFLVVTINNVYLEVVSEFSYIEYIHSDAYYTIYISDNYLNSFIRLEPLWLKKDTEHTVNFHKRIIEQKLEEPYNQCTHMSNESYRQMNCIELCINREVVKSDNCSAASYYPTTGLELCPYLDTMLDDGIDLSTYHRSLFESNCTSQCEAECDSVQFTFQNTEAPNNMPNTTSFWFIPSDLSSLEITQIPKMSPIDLISNIGGTLGLFVGMTFLSFIEIIDFILNILIIIFIH